MLRCEGHDYKGSNIPILTFRTSARRINIRRESKTGKIIRNGKMFRGRKLSLGVGIFLRLGKNIKDLSEC